MFKLRIEYRDYVNDCIENGEVAWCFRQWAETTFWYDWQDNLQDPHIVFCRN